jgi:hypothetical protein
MALNRESLIQVLRSTTTDVPSGLTFGELAYSDLNGKLFVGDADGNSVWIGAEVTAGSISTNSQYLVPTQSAVKTYVDGVVGGGSVVNSINGTGGNITVTGDGQSQIATVSGTTTTFSNRLASTSVTGVASFSSDNFAVGVGGEVTIKNGGVANDELVNSSVTVSAGTGLGGGGAVSLGGSVTLANTGVLSLNGLTGARTLTGDGGALSGVGNDTIAIRVASTSVTGAASFSSDNFTVGAGGEVTIKNGGVANDELVNSSIMVAGGGGSSTISLGQTLTITGTTDEIEVSNSSGTITIGLPDNVTITGNLTVNGTVVTANVDNFVVEDPMIVLGTGNSGDSLDLGFYAKYVSGTTKYTGLFRDAPGGKYRLFSGLEVEPNTTVNTAGAGYAVATLVANIDGGSF